MHPPKTMRAVTGNKNFFLYGLANTKGNTNVNSPNYNPSAYNPIKNCLQINGSTWLIFYTLKYV